MIGCNPDGRVNVKFKGPPFPIEDEETIQKSIYDSVVRSLILTNVDLLFTNHLLDLVELKWSNSL